MRFLLIVPGVDERHDVGLARRDVTRAHNLVADAGGGAFLLTGIGGGPEPLARAFSLARWRTFGLPLASFDGVLAVGETPRVRALWRQAEAAGQRVWPACLFDRAARDLMCAGEPSFLPL